MKTKTKKTDFFLAFPEPRKMLPLEQVFCMMYLAQNFSMKELRNRQVLIGNQLADACDKKCNQKVIDDLDMMYANHCAAVAYQTFKDETWMLFIK